MATVINTPATRDTADGAAAGWAVAVVVIVAVALLALFVWPGYVRQSAAPATTPGANINVTMPSSDTTGTGGNAGGATNDTGSGGTQSSPSGQTAPAQ